MRYAPPQLYALLLIGATVGCSDPEPTQTLFLEVAADDVGEGVGSDVATDAEDVGPPDVIGEEDCACGDEEGYYEEYEGWGEGSEPDAGATGEFPTAPFGSAPQLGVDGNVTYEVVLGTPWIYAPRDLAFDPLSPGHLWVSSGADDAFVFLDLSGDEVPPPQKFTDYYHSYADEVSALSFSRDRTFASCQETLNTVNGSTDGDGIAGATLWPADPEVFHSKSDSTLNGPVIDALTGSALCMGIGWVREHAFYVFDGEKGDLELFDFKRESLPGSLDPAGGVKYRILKGELAREPGVPSHMAYHPDSKKLFVADTGNKRILWLLVDSGEPGTTIFNNSDLGTDYKKWVNAIWDVWTPEVELQKPSGMLLHNDRLFISDHETGEILAFDLEGKLLNRLDTGRGAGALAGLEMDPQGRLLFVDMLANEVIRVEP